jgi:UDP-N-acetylmuramoyl-tripeptide--D-alanyl-D-alanine ligase
LAEIAAPSIAVVNNAQRAHLGGLGSVDAIALEKGEIYEALPKQGIAVLNAGDPFLPLWKSIAGPRPHLSFGPTSSADLWWCGDQIMSPWGSRELKLAVVGSHNRQNALAAAAVGLAAGVPLSTVADALAAFSPVTGRLETKSGHQGAVVIDDSYNANPDSMRAAISLLASQPGKRVLLIGDMGELGRDAGSLHAEIGRAARKAGIELLIATGELMRQAVESFGKNAIHCPDHESTISAAQLHARGNTTILVKGSRFMAMERIVDALVAKEPVC